MPNRKRRLGLASMIGVLCGVMISGGITWYLYSRGPETRPLEMVLWVCDEEVKYIYGPGTPEQKSIVKQLKATGFPEKRYSTPILYRMGAGSSSPAPQGILMIPFDPEQPEMALGLISDNTDQPKK